MKQVLQRRGSKKVSDGAQISEVWMQDEENLGCLMGCCVSDSRSVELKAPGKGGGGQRSPEKEG